MRRQRGWFATTLLALCWLGGAACRRPLAEGTIGPKGGTVAAADGTSVAVPAGALSSDVQITISPAMSVQVPLGFTQIGPSYVFGPDGLQFSAPVTVTLTFAPASLPTGVEAADAVVLSAPANANTDTVLAAVPTDTSHVEASLLQLGTSFVAIGGSCRDFPCPNPAGVLCPVGPCCCNSNWTCGVDDWCHQLAVGACCAGPDAGAVDAGRPDAGACHPGSCSGCCDGTGACVAGTTLAACGTGGGQCAACGACQTCSAGACTGGPCCSSATCTGCCDTSLQCQPGDSPSACGSGGSGCLTCLSGQVCDALRQCDTPDAGVAQDGGTSD